MTLEWYFRMYMRLSTVCVHAHEHACSTYTCMHAHIHGHACPCTCGCALCGHHGSLDANMMHIYIYMHI